MDFPVFAFFAAACLGTAVLFGLAPALHTSNLNVSETLNESGRGTAGTRSARRWAGALVILQLALAPAVVRVLADDAPRRRVQRVGASPMIESRNLRGKPAEIPLQDQSGRSRFPLAPSTERD